MYRVAIVGRPNVGKSTLFNRLSRSRRALVSNEPGMTRDRIFKLVEWEGRQFELIDTGGILMADREEIPEKIFEQAELAVQGADLVLLVVDVRSGPTPLDLDVARYLQSRGSEFWVVANKVDVASLENDVYQFAELGADIMPVSAEHGLGLDDLLERLLDRIPERPREGRPDEIQIAIIGRPNVGKSSLVNRLLGQDRVIVTDIPGTTRDAVDSLLRYEERFYRIIDTAGIRRKGRTDLKAEKLSVVMAERHIRLCDVVLLVIDASEGATKLDATIGGYAHEAGRPVVIVVNKWDLVEKDTQTAIRLEREYRMRMKFLDYAPMLFVSALSGQRAFKTLELARTAYESSRVRISTSELNAFLQEEVAARMMQRDTDRKFPLKFACQVSSSPPTFVLFLRGSGKLHFSTLRFLSNRLRERYGFFATPLRLLQRPQGKYSRKGRGR